MNKVKSILSLLLMLSLFVARAQQTEWYMQADTNKILIGEQIQVKLRATVGNAELVQWPMVGDTLSDAEVIDRSEIDTTFLDSKMLLEQRLTVTVWDSGYYVIQPLPLLVNGDSIFSDPLFLTVNTIDQLQEAPYDIKAPEDAPKTLGEWLQQLGLWIALAGALIGLFAWWRSRRKKEGGETKVEARVDPYEQAVSDLGRLRENKLWQKGEVKEYYDALTDIARRYLEQECGIPALESTTEETRTLLIDQPIKPEVREDFIGLMREADMVKFAKERFGDEDCECAFRRARNFIDAVHESALFERKALES